MIWAGFVKGAVGLLLIALCLALGMVTFMIVFGSADAAEKGRLQAVGAGILVPTLTAVLGLLVAVAGVKAAATVWYNVHRKDGDPPLPIALFEW